MQASSLTGVTTLVAVIVLQPLSLKRATMKRADRVIIDLAVFFMNFLVASAAGFIDYIALFLVFF